MVANQQLFYLNPIPVPPSSVTDLNRRYARLHELNLYSQGAFGDTVKDLYIETRGVTYSMLPLWPSTASLTGRFVIQAAQKDLSDGFIYQVDSSGSIVKVR
jgi:hypothetical protein